MLYLNFYYAWNILNLSASSLILGQLYLYILWVRWSFFFTTCEVLYYFMSSFVQLKVFLVWKFWSNTDLFLPKTYCDGTSVFDSESSYLLNVISILSVYGSWLSYWSSELWLFPSCLCFSFSNPSHLSAVSLSSGTIKELFYGNGANCFSIVFFMWFGETIIKINII